MKIVIPGDWEKQAEKVSNWHAACCPSVVSVCSSLTVRPELKLQ